jgi:hypothetical protein
MKCNISPETNDSCVVVTVEVPECLQIEGADCYRQSEINTQVMNKVCAIDAAVTTIQASIDLSDLTGCDSLTPVGTTVVAEFQNLYDAVCALKADLSLPLDGAIDTKCLVDQCGDPIATLGDLLQAMVDAICCIAAEVPDASGCVDL